MQYQNPHAPFHYHGFADQFIGRFLKQRYADRTSPVIIAVGGPGGSGKSTFCERIARTLGEAAVMTTDDYKLPRHERPGHLLGSHPNANKLALLREHLQMLKQGQRFEHPRYDDKSGEIHETELFTPKRFNLIDGELASFDGIREFADFLIYIDADWVTQLHARITRDVEQRHCSPEKAIHIFMQSNLKDHPKIGMQTKAHADLVLFCREDRHIIIQSVAEKHHRDLQKLTEKDTDRLNFSGLIVALTTPFNAQLQIDKQALVAHLSFLEKAGVKRILINGTTGEFFSLLPAERQRLLILARRYFSGLLIFNASAESLCQTIEQCHWAHDFGADAVLVLPPYYYADVHADGIIDYFRKLDRILKIPMIIYNFPKHTNISFSPDMLSRIPHLALKDSSSDLSLIPHTPGYLLGGDEKILEASRKKGTGFFSARANVFPMPYIRMEDAIRRNAQDAATAIQQEIDVLRTEIHSPNEIQKIKKALSETLPGYPPHVRLPLKPIE